MNITDPIADMLTRIRNAVMVKHESVLVPISKAKVSIAKILKEEGFIRDFETIDTSLSTIDTSLSLVLLKQIPQLFYS